jgi:hypothetical protein
MRKIKYWRSRNIKDTKGENIETDIQGLFSFLHKCRYNIPSKQQIPVWAPVTFNGTRAARNVQDIHCLVLDIDDGLKYWDVEPKLRTSCIYYWHYTYSHTEALHKWRAIFPLVEPVPKEEWLDYWEAGQKWFSNLTGHEGTDQVCKDAGRAYYVKASKNKDWCMGLDVWEKPFLLDLRSIVTDIRKEKRFQAMIKRDLQKRQQELLKELPKADQERLERNKQMNSKEARTRKAQDLGATITDGIARNIKCPRCNRSTVWFGLDSEKKKSAECNHKNSCGWFGFVNNL